jgi:hypothetical protein
MQYKARSLLSGGAYNRHLLVNVNLRWDSFSGRFVNYKCKKLHNWPEPKII